MLLYEILCLPNEKGCFHDTYVAFMHYCFEHPYGITELEKC